MIRPRTLYAKLALVLFAIFLVIAVVFSAIILRSTELYREEVGLRLQEEVAPHIAGDRTLIDEGRVDQSALESLFHDLMVINPAIELYLLDTEGNILAYSAPPGDVVLDRVSLEPVERLLGARGEQLIRGDDPRNSGKQKFFSAAPIRSADGQLEGYLYIILSSEQVDSVAGRLATSQIVRTTATLALLSLLFALVAGLLTFHLLTRRLRRLNEAVVRFQRGDFSRPLEEEIDTTSNDEIGNLGRAIQHMSQRIIDQLQELKRTDELRRELVANVSHDLRTPLAALQGYIETVLVKEESLSPDERRECLEIARRHGERLGKLIAELFELSKLEANEAKPQFETCSMGELIQDVVQKFEVEAKSKGIELRSVIPSDLPPARIDIGLMERVLQNLIENALRFTPHDGRIEIAIDQIDDRLRVRVSDTGVGIAEEEIPYVFERFYRSGRRDVSRTTEGAGLGLAIAKKIVELHGSTLEVASQLQRGTTFTFYPPIVH